MEVTKDNETDGEKNNKKESIEVPNIVGLSIKEAEKLLRELGIEIKIEGEGIDKENTVIKEQIPKEGITVNKGNKIIVKH